MNETKFVISVNETTFTIARLNPSKTWFCGYQEYKISEYPDIKLGQEVKVVQDNLYLLRKDELTIVNRTPNEEIIKMYNNYYTYREELKKKYGNKRIKITINQLIDKYIIDRMWEEKKINKFVGYATYIFCKVMGIKVRDKYSYDNYQYGQLGFEYPEDALEVINAIYEYIERYIMHGTGEKTFVFYDGENFGLSNDEYNKLRKYLEENTYFSSHTFSSDIDLHIKSYNGQSDTLWARAKYSTNSIIIAPYQLTFRERYSHNEYVEKVVYSNKKFSDIGNEWPFIDAYAVKRKSMRTR